MKNENDVGFYIPIRINLPEWFNTKPSIKSGYTYLCALYCLQKDYFYNNLVSESQYSKQWGWDRATVNKFINDCFVKIETPHLRSKGSLVITPEGKKNLDKIWIIDIKIKPTTKTQ